jgi:hypothetical protein
MCLPSRVDEDVGPLGDSVKPIGRFGAVGRVELLAVSGTELGDDNVSD